MQQVGIVGNGYVGGATALLGNDITIKTLIHDKDPDKCSPLGLRFEELLPCDFVFVCVPTPMNEDGSCSVAVVEKVVSDLERIGYDKERIIIKSTVPVGTSRKLNTMFMPAFLTEKNWKQDFLSQRDWILGSNVRNDKIRDELYQLFTLAFKAGTFSYSPHVFFCTTEEAEMLKYVRNCFLATKVSFFNEVAEFCDTKENVDFERVRRLAVLDGRIGSNHTVVPGPDGKRGFGGTCFPKDMSSVLFQIKEAGMESFLIEAALVRNSYVDRPEKDWENDKGRAVI